MIISSHTLVCNAVVVAIATTEPLFVGWMLSLVSYHSRKVWIRARARTKPVLPTPLAPTMEAGFDIR